MRIADPYVEELNKALAASKDAIDQLMVAGERTATAWTAPRAPGKWSPSQIVEHVARSLEESANMAAGRPANGDRLARTGHNGRLGRKGSVELIRTSTVSA